MKNTKNTTQNTERAGLCIPTDALTAAGFSRREETDCLALKNAVVVLKKQMNALELVRAAWSLLNLSIELTEALVDECGQCNNGELCGTQQLGCPFDPLDFATPIEIPDDLRELAGIEKGVPLHVELLEDGEITILPNRDGPGLWDVPAPMMQLLLKSGVCAGYLESLLKSGEIIYGDA